MADQVLHGKVLLFFARYLAVDIFGLSVIIVVVIARGRRSSEVRPRSEAERRERERRVGRQSLLPRSDLGDIRHPPTQVRN